MIRVCPKRDAVCPHGMACPYTIDRYECAEEPPMTLPRTPPQSDAALIAEAKRAASDLVAIASLIGASPAFAAAQMIDRLVDRLAARKPTEAEIERAARIIDDDAFRQLACARAFSMKNGDPAGFLDEMHLPRVISALAKARAILEGNDE
jgi:hypothetical protein